MVNQTIVDVYGTYTTLEIGILSQFAPYGPFSVWYPQDITFTDNSIGSPTAWNWSFGDGTCSDLQNPPAHMWPIPGMYLVTLNASNADGYSINSTWVESGINGFTVSTSTGIEPLLIAFANTTVGNVTLSEWDFGDGSTSGDVNPTHIYTNIGNFTSNYTVVGLGGYLNSTYINIKIYEQVVASFNAVPTEGLVPLTVILNDTSNNATSWNWVFGDGTPNSTMKNVSHTFTEIGDYTVTLYVGNDITTSNTSKKIEVWSEWKPGLDLGVLAIQSIIFIIPAIVAIIGLGLLIYSLRHMGEPHMGMVMWVGLLSFLAGLVIIIIMTYMIYIVGGTLEDLIGW